MWTRNNKLLLVKILPLLVILILSGLTVSGCSGIRNTPEGGSGGAVADGTLFICPTLKQGGSFGCAAPPTEGKLIAVSTSGNLLWEAPLESSEAAGGGFGCAEFVHNFAGWKCLICCLGD